MLHILLLGVLQQQVLPDCPGTERDQGKPLRTHTHSHKHKYTELAPWLAGASLSVCKCFPRAGGCQENEKYTVGLQSLPEQLKERRAKRQRDGSYVWL